MKDECKNFKYIKSYDWTGLSEQELKEFNKAFKKEYSVSYSDLFWLKNYLIQQSNTDSGIMYFFQKSLMEESPETRELFEV